MRRGLYRERVEPKVPALARLLGGPPDRVWGTASGAVLAVRGDVVAKLHPAGTDAADLAARLRVASDPRLAGVLAAPLRPEPVTGLLPDGVATLWPRLDVLAVDTPTAPWEQAARTLAVLHRAPPAERDVPAHGAPDRLQRAVRRLADASGHTDGDLPSPDALGAIDPVLAAGRAVLDDVRRAGPQPLDALVHGDWHLGQLGRDRDGRWLLLDLDDLGAGDPAWDLGRPAGFWAAGLLDDATWTAILAGYRAAGGPGVPADGDPWPRLDVPARAEVVVAAARALLRTLRGEEDWDDDAEALVAACARM